MERRHTGKASGQARPLASVVPHVDAGALLVADHDHIVLGSLPEPFKTYWPKAGAQTFALVN